METSPLIHAHLPDGGPVYTETDLSHSVAEPFNAVTAALFLLLALYFGYRLRGRYRRFPFLASCLALLAVGGVGGTLFHAFRVSRVFFLMDVVPIGLIATALSIYLWLMVLPRRWMLLPAVVPFFLAHRFVFAELPRNYAISGSYALLALLVVLPLVLVLWRTGWLRWRLVVATVGLFVVGLTFRTVDPTSGSWISVGTHWLWHSFSALAVAALIRYLEALGDWRSGVEGATAVNRVSA